MVERNASLVISPDGMTFIKLFESFVAYPYDDLVVSHGKYPEWTGGKAIGTITIGYGSTSSDIKIVPGMRLTEAQASDLLEKSLERVYGPKVKQCSTRALKQCEFDALVSWAYNTGAPTTATVWKMVNSNSDVGPALMQWTKSKGQVLQGLVRRRKGEIALYEGNIAEALKIARQ